MSDVKVATPPSRKCLISFGTFDLPSRGGWTEGMPATSFVRAHTSSFPRAVSLRVDQTPSPLQSRPPKGWRALRSAPAAPPMVWRGQLLGANRAPAAASSRTGCDRSPGDGRTGRPSSLFHPDRTMAVSGTGAGPPPLRWAKATAGRSAGGRPYCIQPARCSRPPNGREQRAPLRSPPGRFGTGCDPCRERTRSIWGRAKHRG